MKQTMKKSIEDTSIMYLFPRGKKKASYVLWLNLGVIIDPNIKGLSRVINRTTDVICVPTYKETFYIKKNYIKDIFKGLYLLKDGIALDTTCEMFIPESLYHKIKKRYDKGFMSDELVLNKNYMNCTQPRIAKEDALMISNQLEIPNWIKDEIISAIKEFKHSRIGKIFIDVENGNKMHRVYIDSYLKLDQTQIEELNSINQNSNIKIHISKNR